jgi:hypothetical protein
LQASRMKIGSSLVVWQFNLLPSLDDEALLTFLP